MPGKTYNAGTIFLQVVPVFGDVQNAIRREAKDINKALGDELEQGGREAGARAGKAASEELGKAGRKGAEDYAGHFETQVRSAVKAAQKELNSLDFKTASDKTLADVDRIKRALRDLSDTGVDLDPRKALTKLEMVNAALDGIVKGDHDIDIQVNVQKMRANLKQVEDLVDRTVEKRREMLIDTRLDTRILDRELGAFEKKIKSTAKKAADALGDPIHRELRSIKNELNDLGDAEIGIDISDAEARRKIEELMRDARRLAFESPEIQVKVDAGRAELELAKLYSEMRIIDGTDVDVKVDVDTSAAAAKLGAFQSLFNNADGVDAAANSFRSFNIRVLAAVTLLPGLIPIIGAVGGALLGLVPVLAAVGAGFGAMLVGFSGIGDAVGALGEASDNAAKDTSAASKTIRSASYAVADARDGVADAERNAAQATQDARRNVADAARSAAQANADAARQVADARRQAADAVEDAIDRQREAQEEYRDSVQDVREAEADLREARKQAIEEDAANSADLKDRARQNKLDIREAILGAFDATNSYNATMADGSSTAYDKEAAEVNMLQARESLHELRDLERELAKERKTQRKEGINDNSAVESAQDALTAALERQRDAQEAVGEAARAVNEARIDGARAVQDALRNQAQTEADGVRSVADARRAQQRAYADGQRSIARAQEQLRRAQEDYGQALYETGELGSASMQNLEEAMGKLGPAGQKFARFLFSLRDNWYRFRDAIQTAMLPGVQRAFETIINTYGPQFTSFMVRMGAVVGDFFENLADSLTGDAWRKFFGIMDQIGPKMAAQFGRTTLNWMEVFASVMTAVAPFAERLSLAMLRLSEGAAAWAASAKGQASITSFMEYAAQVGPAVVNFLESFVAAAINLGIALAPWGAIVMNALTGILDFIAGMDPETLGVIATAVIGLTIAWQAATGAVAAYFAGQSAFATLAGRLVFGIIAIGVGLAILAIRSERVREALAAVGDWISEHRGILIKLATAVLTVVAAYKIWRLVTATVAGVQLGLAAATYGAAGATYAQGFAAKVTYGIMRVWMGVTIAMTAVQRILNMTMLGFPLYWVVAAIAAVVIAIVLLWKKNEGFRNAVIKLWEAIKKAFAKAWDFIKPVLNKLGDAIVWLWKKVFKPAFGFIWDIVQWTFKAIKTVWNKVLWPVIKFIAKIIWWLFKSNFKVAFGLIEVAWKVLVVAFKAWWKFHGEPLFNAVAAVLKWLWREIFRPTFNWIGDAWRDMVQRIKDNWNKYGKPLFDLIGEKVLPKLKDAFRDTVDNIKGIWDDLKRIIGAPIRFVIQTVLNDGLIAGFNKVANFVNGPTIDKIKVPEWTYARGTPGALGVMPGYTPGRDVHEFYSPTAGKLHLSGGEPIMRPEFGRVVGTDWIDEMNRAARFGGVSGVKRALGGQRFAKGGVWHPGTRSQRAGHGMSLDEAWDINSPGGQGTPVRAFLDGIVSFAGWGGADSYGNYIKINHAAAGLQSLYAHLHTIAVRAGQAVGRGQVIGTEGNTGNSFGAHLHFELGGGSSAIAAAGSGGGDGGPQLPGWLSKIIGKPMEWAKGLLDKASDVVTDKFGGSPFISTIMGLGEKLLGPLVDKVTSVFEKNYEAMNVMAGVKSGAATTAVQLAVQRIASNYGWGGGNQWASLVKLLQGESGWDPTAENPTTSASGLFQFIDGTAQAYGLPGHASNFSVSAQAKAGLKYIKARYGSPANAYQTWLSRDPHWYKDGGVLPADLSASGGGEGGGSGLAYNGTMKYDAGGYLPPGITNVVNLTGKPEPVFTADQFERGIGQGGGITYAPVITEANLTSGELMSDFEFTARKLTRRGGKYQGVQG